jgi:hypothetical protein
VSRNGNSPRILYVTSRWPYKHGSGTHLRSFHVLKALQHVGSVRVVVLDDERKKSDMAVQAGNEYDLADVLDVHSRCVEALDFTT